MRKENSQPLLSVCLITFNHAPYIRQAIEGVLMQQTSFPIELIIADDCSTDGTREILLEYKERHPHFVKLILQKTNVGAARNWLDLIHSPQSKYAAYFEGDDYWIDPLKLQKQVDFLESNPEFCLTFHNTYDFISPNKSVLMYPNLEIEEFTIQDFITHTYARSVSIVFRQPKEMLPPIFEKIKLGDSAWFIFLLQKGKAKFFKEPMANYRIHSSGLWNSRTSRQKARSRFQMYLGVLEFISEDHKPQIHKILQEFSISFCIYSLLDFDFRQAIIGMRYFLSSPMSFKINKFSRAIRNRLASNV